ncbi:hypothetical protein V1524DRAFT_447169 [Lipomyces starkeyi]
MLVFLPLATLFLSWGIVSGAAIPPSTSSTQPSYAQEDQDFADLYGNSSIPVFELHSTLGTGVAPNVFRNVIGELVDLFRMHDHADVSRTLEFTSLLVDNNVTVATHENMIEREALRKRALHLPYLAYHIRLDGRNLGNWQNFVTTGYLFVTQGITTSPTNNGRNPYELILLVGQPYTSPAAGSIRFFANRYLYKAVMGSSYYSLLDYVFMTLGRNSITAKIDTRIAAANQLSCFNAHSGLFANCYNIAAGTFQINSSLRPTIYGGISLIGTGYTFYSRAPYSARFSATLVGKGNLAL